jgi:hypothetical protein
MRHCNAILLLLLCFTLLDKVVYAQDSSVYSRLYNLPDKLLHAANAKSIRIEQRLTKQTTKYLAQLQKEEQRLKKKLWKKDSTAAKELFDDVSARYKNLENGLENTQTIYSGHLDSMQTVLRFLRQDNLVGLSPATKENLQTVLGNYNQLQEQLNYTSEIKRQLKERQQYLKQHLEKLGLSNEIKKLSRSVYYYRAQIDEYKRTFEEPSKLEARLLQLANKIPAFREFFNKNSMLAGLFRLPGSDPVISATPIPGLQTRASIQQDMLQRFGSGPDVSRTMQQNIQSAQVQIQQLKEKVNQLGGGGSDMDMPDFPVNHQKVKRFWQRVELSANVQSTKNNNFYPVTSDLALMAGYRLGNRSTIGIGASYKVGWGQNIRQIKLTHEGVGLRSFLEVKLRGSFYASAGFEYNYQKPFGSLQQLNNLDSWQKSGLLGVSKIVAIQSKFFKKTKLQLLWDVLSYQQVPRSQPIKFRIGYYF